MTTQAGACPLDRMRLTGQPEAPRGVLDTTLHFFFDLDGTLYSADAGLWDQIKGRIRLFLQLRLGLSASQARELHRYFVQKYGTTLRGLQNEYPEIDPHDYFAFAHNVPVEAYLKPNQTLRKTLNSLPGKHWLFTNADAAHAERVLSALGITDCFMGIIDIFATRLFPKPHPKAYTLARKLAGSPPPEQCVLVDDLPQNLPPAKNQGWRTVLVSKSPAPHADLVVPNVYTLPIFFTRGKV